MRLDLHDPMVFNGLVKLFMDYAVKSKITNFRYEVPPYWTSELYDFIGLVTTALQRVAEVAIMVKSTGMAEGKSFDTGDPVYTWTIDYYPSVEEARKHLKTPVAEQKEAVKQAAKSAMLQGTGRWEQYSGLGAWHGTSFIDQLLGEQTASEVQALKGAVRAIHKKQADEKATQELLKKWNRPW